MKKIIPQSLRNYYHWVKTFLSVLYFQFPSRKIKIIGVTGTDGKTTTVQMISGVLEEAGYRVAVLSTINFRLGDKSWVNRTKYTTRSAWHVQKFIKKAVDEKCEYLVLEVSSHALDQNRVWGVDFDVAVLTNVTREHLDYHKTMDRYRKAKRILFANLSKSCRKGAKKVTVVNLDMQNPKEFLSFSADEKYAYFVQKENKKMFNNAFITKKIIAKNLKNKISGSSFVVDGVRFDLNLMGDFNVENALAAISVGFSQGINLKIASDALKKIDKIEGRMDEVQNDFGFRIFIDYALTPDSMEKLACLLKKMQENGAKRIIWVFGSCGDRDKGKRPIMGKIVAGCADLVIVTNEDPYNEDPHVIIDEVFKGVLKDKKKQEGRDAFRVFEREDALKKAMFEARKGDILIITGKGAEETMMIKGKQIPWNDKQKVIEILKCLK